MWLQVQEWAGQGEQGSGPRLDGGWAGQGQG